MERAKEFHRKSVVVLGGIRKPNFGRWRTPSITAVTGEQLAAAGVSGAQAIAQSTPGVAVGCAGPGKSIYNINGSCATRRIRTSLNGRAFTVATIASAATTKTVAKTDFA